MRKRLLAVIACFLIALAMLPAESQSGEFKEESEYVPHAPIRIDSNAEFDQAHGVVNWATGNGTVWDPWVIEGWDINGSALGTCIFIGNTTDYFEIKKCYLHDADGTYSWPYFRNAGIHLYYASNGRVDNNTLQSNIYAGLSIFYSHNTNVTYNTINDGNWGVYSEASNNNVFINNTVYQTNKGISLSWTGASVGSHNNKVISNNLSNNPGTGLKIQRSINNTAINNKLCWNGAGMYTSQNEFTIIKGNNISNNGNNWMGYGISIQDLKSAIISNNSLYNNWGSGFLVGYSENITFKNNTIIKGGFCLRGFTSYDFNTYSIDESNTVNGKPVYYMKNQTGVFVPSYAGQVLLANCTNMIIENFNFQNLYAGIILGCSDNITISNVTSINNVEGLYTQYSYNNTIKNCTFSNNEMHGIWFEASDGNDVYSNIVSYNRLDGFRCVGNYNNTIHNNNVSHNTRYAINMLSGVSGDHYIYHNNFINNGIGNQTYDGGINFWNLSYPGGGNYWSDYNGIDLLSGPGQDQPGSDGIGDSNYSIGGGGGSFDEYPLMMPIEFQFTNHNVSLSEGWNLVSLPVIQSDESLDKVLESIDGKWDHIQTYNALNSSWKSNNTYRPDSLNDFDILNHKVGFWINITEPGGITLTVIGYDPPLTSIPLYAGWNLVGYPTLNNTTTVANALFGTTADAVEVFDPAESYHIKEVGPSYVMKPGEGYWIHVVADSVWTIDW